MIKLYNKGYYWVLPYTHSLWEIMQYDESEDTFSIMACEHV